MKAVVLDGGRGDGTDTATVVADLRAALGSAGWNIESVSLRDEDIGACRGCFGCWITTPGICVNDDAGRRPAKAAAQADLVVFVTPVTFGGYSSQLKKALDRMIGNISPFFALVHGETHHERRYERSPKLLAIGVSDGAPVPEEVAVFKRLVARNAVNLHSSLTIAEVDPAAGSVGGLLEAMGVGDTDRVASVDIADRALGFMDGGAVPSPDGGAGSAPRTALLLVGSPRRKRSTSAAVGGYLLQGLEARGIATESLYVHSAIREGAGGVERLVSMVRTADLVVLSSPLYVDSLPARVIQAMEEIFAAFKSTSPAGDAGTEAAEARDTALVAIVNSGFPEASQCAVALSICHRFARRMDFRWSGGFALGGGGAIDGRPLEAIGGIARNARQALDQAAAALAEGAAVPEEALGLMGRPAVPASDYRFLGDRGWRQAAAARGVEDRLDDRPYQETGEV